MARSIQVPSKGIIDNILEVYERGLTIDALRRAESFGSLKNWGGMDACVLASRIAMNCGAPRLSTRLSVRAWRTDPSHPVGRLQYGFELGARRGPLALWRKIREWKISPQGEAEQQAEMLALQAHAASELRDFAAAENMIQRAEELCPTKPWIRLQRARLLEKQDRPEEALEIARAACALHPHPFYRPGTQTIAQLLQLLDRDEDAIELLQQADAVLQNGPVAAQCYGLLSENGRWPEAEAALMRYVQLSPLMEQPLQQWVTAQRARTAYHLNKRVEAASLARGLEDEFHKSFAKNLEAPANGTDRLHLDVSFVRQHFKTCAPATLAAIGRFWRMPTEHLKLAEAMCYDGTPHWQQREWAEQNGWLVREFRVTRDNFSTLIAKGIPFAISTVQATSAHMQAAVGFDRVRDTILLRDPSQPYTVEAFAEPFFKYQRSFGPHGMVFIPLAEAARLDGLALLDADIYDGHHRFNLCLKKHDRVGAANILQALAEAHGDHALVWEARLALAGYDANMSEQLRCVDKLLELFPDSPARQLRRLNCLQNVSRPERLEFLERICHTPGTEPVFFIELARALSEDARQVPEANQWLRRASRLRSNDSNAMTVQADLLWMEGVFEEATELYRFAANLEGYRENLYRSWFSACRRTRRTDEAMVILEDRFKRFGTLSEQPGLTLAWAWRELDKPQRAREIYAEAARLRPENGYVLLNAANLETRLQNPAETARLLQVAKDKVRKTDWLRASAEIAELSLDTAASLQASREILDHEPLQLDAHGGVARALAQLEGSNASLAHLKAACARFPHHYGLQRMLVEWSRKADAQEAEEAARKLLRIDPSDAWARRELSTFLLKAGRNDEALHEATVAAEIEPRNSYSFSILGHIEYRRKQPALARAQFRRAIEFSVDNTDALNSLLDLMQTDKERKDELAFIEAQLIVQVVKGDGLLTFRDLAGPVLEPEALLRSLESAYQARPDLWHAWSALASQLGHLKRLDEALAIARQATERFPHLPRIWLDLSRVHQWRKENDAEIAAASRAFEMNPSWTRASLALSGALERDGKLAGSRKTFERALQHSSHDAQLHACYAHLLWRLREPDTAFTEVERALRIAPGYEWAWDLMQGWATERGESKRAADFARLLTIERPGEKHGWLTLARVLGAPDDFTERMSAVDRALALEPRLTEAWDLKAEILTGAERFDEAIQATRDGTEVCVTDVYVLRGRHAWIEARRRRLTEAVRLMRQVLAENALYVWGWNQLAHWLIEQEAFVDAAAALENLQRLRPHDSWVRRQLGFLKLKQGDRADAQKYFAATLQASPTDAFAAQHLFDLQLKSADLKGAEETLRVMQLHQPGAGTASMEIQLLLRKAQNKAAGAAFEKLCATSDPDAWPIDAAASAYQRAGQTGKAVRILKRAARSAACNPQTAAAAIRLLLARQSKLRAVWFFMSLKPGELRQRAATPLVHGLAECKARFWLRWVLWRRRQVFLQDDEAWGKVGYALSNFNQSKKATL